MVHVYPYETDPKKIWSTDDDDQGHDNMDHSVMPGMKMTEPWQDKVVRRLCHPNPPETCQSNQSSVAFEG